MATTTIKPVSLLSDALGTLLVRLFGTLLVFATTWVTARVLGPHEYGTYNAGLSLAILLATLAPLGTDRVVVRNLSAVRTPREAGPDTALSHICTAVMSLLLLLAGALQYALSDVLSISGTWQQTCFLAAIMFIPIALTNLRQWIAIPLVGSRYAVLPEQTVVPVCFLCLVGLAGLWGFEVAAISASCAYAVIAMTVWVVSLLRDPIRSAYAAALRTSPARAQVRAYAQSAVPFISMSVGCMLLQRCVPLLMVLTCGFAETAQFSVAQQFAGLATIPLGVAALVILPQCSRQCRLNQTKEATHTVRQAATVTFLLALVIALLTWLASPWLVDLFGSSWARVREILPTLLIVSIVESLSGPSVAVMQSMRMEQVLARVVIGFIPVQLALIYGMSWWGGLEGGAAGLLLARLLWIALIVRSIYSGGGILALPWLNLRRAGLLRILSRTRLTRLS